MAGIVTTGHCREPLSSISARARGVMRQFHGLHAKRGCCWLLVGSGPLGPRTRGGTVTLALHIMIPEALPVVIVYRLCRHAQPHPIDTLISHLSACWGTASSNSTASTSQTASKCPHEAPAEAVAIPVRRRRRNNSFYPICPNGPLYPAITASLPATIIPQSWPIVHLSGLSSDRLSSTYLLHAAVVSGPRLLQIPVGSVAPSLGQISPQPWLAAAPSAFPKRSHVNDAAR
ncbi:hypothetical protein BU26DRAFT_579667 [Trematosphaeria pertusa]|uniref:Uncharacterized protein n=1 Tax=Trematosphaeria pertusa TaxID=390896 RepID=A0A6A6I4G1_9PLEO|nr:uncharacterized protein BU26DRAFT_579667 [Trematosphaeria pertusa]KAF2244908.1 hypothetical protein BU26DRAFT_579667 [Trematosphaeria pertusa]